MSARLKRETTFPSRLVSSVERIPWPFPFGKGMVVAGPPPDGQRVFHCNEGFQPGLITTTKRPSFPRGCDKYFLLSQGNDPSPPDVVTVIKPISVPNDEPTVENLSFRPRSRRIEIGPPRFLRLREIANFMARNVLLRIREVSYTSSLSRM